MYALFKDDQQISKWHSTKQAAYQEAYEAGAVYQASRYLSLDDRYEIKEKEDV